MSVTLFAGQNFDGHSEELNRDFSTLSGTRLRNRSSSMKMDENDDRVLLFKKRQWDGKVICRRGVNEITNLGKVQEGGKRGMNNAVSSVRVTNFHIRIRYHIIQDSSGNWPGGIANQAAMDALIGNIHTELNSIWNQGFLEFQDIGHTVHINDDYFDLNDEYDELREETVFQTTEQAAHCFLVNSANALGASVRRENSRRFFVLVRAGNVAGTARTLAHEIGHSLGIGHGTNSDPNLLMSQTIIGSGTDLTDVQIETVHEGLSDPRRSPNALYRIE